MSKSKTTKSSSAGATKSAPATQLAVPSTIPAGFVKVTGPLPEGMIIHSRSPLLKPINFPPAPAMLIGVFKRIFNTKEFGEGTERKQGFAIEIVPHGESIGVALPLVATLKSGLIVQVDSAGHNPTSEYLGRTVGIQKHPDRIPSSKGQAAWNFIVGIYPEGWTPGD